MHLPNVKIHMLALHESDVIRPMIIYYVPPILINALMHIMTTAQENGHQVNIGDVIEYDELTYLVTPIGFSRLTNQEFDRYQREDQRDRMIKTYTTDQGEKVR